jgi:putative hydrolase of the HAD superfamily
MAAGRTTLRAVSLDAAGTLFHPVRPVGVLYAEVAAHHGVRIDADDLHARFRRAFGTAPPLAFPPMPPTELRARERAWWRAVVAEVFRGVAFADFEAYFADLFAFFARPATWRLDPHARSLMTGLRSRGLRTFIVSNFDARVREIIEGLGLGDHIEQVIISSEAGAAKPDPGIFRVALARMGLAPAQVVHVGDTVREDLAAARAAGIAIVLVGGPDVAAEAPDAVVVPDLRQVERWITARLA